MFVVDQWLYRGIFSEDMHQLINICINKEKDRKNQFGAMKRAGPGSEWDKKAKVRAVNGFKCIQKTSV